MSEQIDHPKHYNEHPSGVECIAIVEHFAFNIGNAIKYLWRAGLKGDRVTDLKKAAWYIDREISRIMPREKTIQGRQECLCLFRCAKKHGKTITPGHFCRESDEADLMISPANDGK